MAVVHIPGKIVLDPAIAAARADARRVAWKLAGSQAPDHGISVEHPLTIDLTGWPPGIRVIVRKQRPHPGAQLRWPGGGRSPPTGNGSYRPTAVSEIGCVGPQ